MSTSALLANGGVAGLLAVAGMLGKLALDAWRERHAIDRADHVEHRADRTGAVTDAATANAIVLASLEAVHQENKALRAEVGELRDEIAGKDQKIAGLSDALTEAQTEINRIARELATLTSAATERHK